MVDLSKMEEDELFVDDHNEVPPPDIVAYNELRSCADLHRMHSDGILEIQPEFQRDFVWKSTEQTRFIDSLLKQLPIPSMCFAYDHKQNKWIVIDGLQRISTIIRFLNGEDWLLSKLVDIDPALSGKSAATIKNTKIGPLKTLYTRVQNQSLPVNVLRCDFSKAKHNEYLFTIFHRLNSGGVKLNNQEIRNCIYGGTLNNLLRHLDENKHWRSINLMRVDENYRFVKQELILRFFAFYDEISKYNGLIAKFLNDYMFSNRNAEKVFIDEKRELFQRVVKIIDEKILPGGAPGRITTSVMESLLVGVGINIEVLEGLRPNELQNKYKLLLNDSSVSAASLAEGLSKKDKVSARINAAKKIFSQ